tara:strand:- start:66 stop:377 length:312 start_codon:yes stop_codon:yes gene_type:complete
MTDKLISSLWKAIEKEGYYKEDILGKSRKREIVDVRVAIAQLLYYRLGFTQMQIAKVLEREEHSLINHYVNNMDDRDYFEYKEMSRVLSKVVDRYEEHVANFE